MGTIFTKDISRRAVVVAALSLFGMHCSRDSSRVLVTDAATHDGVECDSNADCEGLSHCEDRQCVPDQGVLGGPCYGNGTCNDGLVCGDGNTCHEPRPGTRGGPCYGNGTCNAGLMCEGYVCTPGPGTNGGRCLDGSCYADLECVEDICTPACLLSCDGQECGLDKNCGESCGVCVDPHAACSGGRCICEATCADLRWECGEVCEHACGECSVNEECTEGRCRCRNVWCGPNCCPSGQTCYEGECCQPSCEGRECGPDGCGDYCGRPHIWCDADAFCLRGVCEPLDEFCGELIHEISVVDEIRLGSDPRVSCEDPGVCFRSGSDCSPERIVGCTWTSSWWSVSDVRIDPRASFLTVEGVPSVYSRECSTIHLGDYFTTSFNVEMACVWNHVMRFDVRALPDGVRLGTTLTATLNCHPGCFGGTLALRVTSIVCNER